jgi:multidrug efflux pump subunit AcrB
MWLLHLSLRRPVSVLILSVSLTLLAFFGFRRMPVDIFPNLNLPVIIVAQPYGGMDAAQMEGYLVYYYEYHFLYITGIDHVESKSVQNGWAATCSLPLTPGSFNYGCAPRSGRASNERK